MAKNRYQYPNFNVLVILLIAILTTLLLGGNVVSAQSASQVGAVLCDSQGPDLQIDNPVSDTIVNTPSLSITGIALRTSQVDVYVNGEYSNSVAIGSNGVLSIQISLKPGTNTIKLNAYFSCNTTSSEETIIVEYVPVLTNFTQTNPSSLLEEPVAVADSSTAIESVLDTLHDEVVNEYGLYDREGGDYSETESLVKVTSNRTLLALVALFSVLYWQPTIFGVRIFKQIGIRIATSKGRAKFRKYIKLILCMLLICTVILLTV